MGAEGFQPVIAVENGVCDALLDRGVNLRQIDDTGKTVFLQAGDEGVFDGRIFVAVLVHDDDADARILHVGANDGLL